jgi:GT2 family glycosyltransferase
MYHEDIELSYRAWKRGWVIRYAPEAVVHHLGSQTTSGVFTDVALRAVIRQNEFLIIWKDITSRRLLASHLAYVPIRLLKAVVTGDRATLRGFVSALRRIGPLLRARRRAAAHFRLSDEEVLALTSEAVIERSARATPLPST